MVAFDGEDVGGANAIGDAEDEGVGQVAAGDEDVGGVGREAALEGVIVGEDQEVHETPRPCRRETGLEAAVE